jgi:hypothetical protein
MTDNTVILREGETPETVSQRVAQEALDNGRKRVEHGLDSSGRADPGTPQRRD